MIAARSYAGSFRVGDRSRHGRCLQWAGVHAHVPTLPVRALRTIFPDAHGLACRVNAVLVGDYLPELGADLVPALACALC